MLTHDIKLDMSDSFDALPSTIKSNPCWPHFFLPSYLSSLAIDEQASSESDGGQISPRGGLSCRLPHFLPLPESGLVPIPDATPHTLRDPYSGGHAVVPPEYNLDGSESSNWRQDSSNTSDCLTVSTCTGKPTPESPGPVPS